LPALGAAERLEALLALGEGRGAAGDEEERKHKEDPGATHGETPAWLSGSRAAVIRRAVPGV
jgi:hypothetical protein